LTLSAAAALAQADEQSLFYQALEQYRSDNFEQALRLFEELRQLAPEDSRADDALWYIGRSLNGLGRMAEAIRSFQEVISLPQRSNRYTEAVTDLARIFLAQVDPEAALKLLEPLKKTEDLQPEDQRALRLLADVRIELSDRDWRAHRDEQARNQARQAISEYELLLGEPRDDKERPGLLEDLGKAYTRHKLAKLE
jgi:tetratricopeptide (TPR) repeat protein